MDVKYSYIFQDYFSDHKDDDELLCDMDEWTDMLEQRLVNAFTFEMFTEYWGIKWDLHVSDLFFKINSSTVSKEHLKACFNNLGENEKHVILSIYYFWNRSLFDYFTQKKYKNIEEYM